MKPIRLACIIAALVVLGASARAEGQQDHRVARGNWQRKQPQQQGRAANPHPQQRAQWQSQPQQRRPRPGAQAPQPSARQPQAWQQQLSQQSQPEQRRDFQNRAPAQPALPSRQGSGYSPRQQGGEWDSEDRGSAGGRRGMWLHYRAQSWRTQHRAWGQRGGYSGYRISEARFQLYFGQGHMFHVDVLPMRIAGGYPEFRMGGYWVMLLDPVPEYWPEDWYQVDDVCIVETEDGYYLVDQAFPDDLVAVSIDMS